MTAYIVGIVMGSITTVFPLIYWMNYDRCVAQILSTQPENLAAFSPSLTHTIATSVTAIGAVVLLVCTLMVAITGLRQLKATYSTAPVPENKEVPQSKAEIDHTDTEEETEF